MMKKLFLLLLLFTLYFPACADTFESLSDEERGSDWAKEYLIGRALLKERDYQAAMDALKRGWVLTPSTSSERKNEIFYYLLLSTFMNGDYPKVVRLFEKSSLQRVDSDFAAYHDLLLMLSKAYERVGQPKVVENLLSKIAAQYPSEAQNIKLRHALSQKQLDTLELLGDSSPKLSYLVPLSKQIKERLKSPVVAKWLGILCPGAGYYYVGQKRSALTSFLFNGLLMVGCWQLFGAKLYTLGVLTLTFEAGWYVGGVLGSARAATSYNNHLFSQLESKVVLQENLLDEELFHNAL